MEQGIWDKLVAVFGEQEVERALEYLETAPQEDILRALIRQRLDERRFDQIWKNTKNLHGLDADALRARLANISEIAGYEPGETVEWDK